jgi:hypothetical protein
MKKLYYSLLSVIAFSGAATAQQAIDFEPGGAGANYVWNVFENATNPALEVVANPFPGGINTSANVAKFTALQAGMPWAGTEINHENGMPDWTLTNSNAQIKIMVYKTVISPVKIKLVTPLGDANPEKSVTNTLVNQWEVLTFNFADYVGAFPVYDQVVVFPDFGTGPRSQDNIVYFDNITFGAAPPPPAPLTAAPTPTAPSSQVISLFSDVYTGINMSTWLTVWSQAAHAEVQIQGNLTKKYSALNFAGIEPAANINATSMNYFNFDVWSADFTQLRIKLVDFGPNGAYQGGDDSEHEIIYATPPVGQWLHYSIPMTDFVNMTARANIQQIIFSTNNAATVFMDNIYFSNNSTAGTNEFASVKTMLYPNPVNEVLTIKSNSSIDEVGVYNTLGQQVFKINPKVSEASINVSALQCGVYMVNTIVNGVLSTQKFIKE